MGSTYQENLRVANVILIIMNAFPLQYDYFTILEFEKNICIVYLYNYMSVAALVFIQF